MLRASGRVQQQRVEKNRLIIVGLLWDKEGKEGEAGENHSVLECCQGQ